MTIKHNGQIVKATLGWVEKMLASLIVAGLVGVAGVAWATLMDVRDLKRDTFYMNETINKLDRRVERVEGWSRP